MSFRRPKLSTPIKGSLAPRRRRLYLGAYELIARLGRGGFGQVILAKKNSTGRHSSSKKFFPLKVVSNPCVYKVENEVLIRALRHPFLVPD
jgi:serine/threonine protein kinase